MANSDVIKQLKERVAALKHEVERLEAAKACVNAGNRYQVHHTKQAVEETHLFALKTPGGAVEMLWGIYDNPEGILRWKRSEGYGELPRPVRGDPGNQHAMCTPIVEVAKDGKTAQALWLMFAYYGEAWAAGQFAMDFIKEGDEWKVWRYNTGGLIFSAFAKGWHKENLKVLNDYIERDRGEFKVDRPPSFPFMWTKDTIFQNIPAIPEPYETWNDAQACIPVVGRKWKIEKFE